MRVSSSVSSRTSSNGWARISSRTRSTPRPWLDCGTRSAWSSARPARTGNTLRHVYLAATGQNRGKTTLSLGVMDGFLRRGLSTGFIKPVGQRTVIEDGVPADEDAVLMKSVFDLAEPLEQMSPVHIPRGFTQSYIDGKVVEDLPSRILAAHAAFVAERDMLLIEGTGHAGVGAVIGLSNAQVAGML